MAQKIDRGSDAMKAHFDGVEEIEIRQVRSSLIIGGRDFVWDPFVHRLVRQGLRSGFQIGRMWPIAVSHLLVPYHWRIFHVVSSTVSSLSTLFFSLFDRYDLNLRFRCHAMPA